MKICTKCNSSKQDEFFPFKYKSKGIRSTICSECQKQYKTAYYNRNKQDYFVRNNKKSEELKAFANSKKISCLICNETEKVCLDFHHLRDKRNDIARITAFGSLQKLKEEIDKCIVLCSNCHRKLHANIISI